MCRVVHGGGVYKQHLQSCREPATFKRIKNCTTTSGRLNLIGMLKKCFRKELKKGGFTIEKVCQYQSIAKTFKNVGNLKRYIQGNATTRKCLNHKPDGSCKSWGYAPPLKLKCTPTEIIKMGVSQAKKIQCFDRTGHENDNLNAKLLWSKRKNSQYWEVRLQLIPGSKQLGDFILNHARLTEDKCGWADKPNAPKAPDASKCVKKIISGDHSRWSCPTHKNLKFGRMCSSFKQGAAKFNKDKDHMWTMTDYNCSCNHNGLEQRRNSDERCQKSDEFAAIEGCKKAMRVGGPSSSLTCVSCGSRPMMLNADGSFNHCETETREKCPKGCRTCSQVVDDNGVAADAVCTTCQENWRPDIDETKKVCRKDSARHNDSRNSGCKIFKVEEAAFADAGLSKAVKDLWKCEKCRPGYAKLMDKEVCESIHTAKGCAYGEIKESAKDSACTCRPGFEIDTDRKDIIHNRTNRVLEWLPEVYMPTSMKAWDACRAKSNDNDNVIITPLGKAQVPHCIHNTSDSIKFNNYLWYRPQKCQACEQGYYLSMQP